MNFQAISQSQYKVPYYDHGIVVDVDKEKAFGLYQLAAQGGSGKAQKSFEQSEYIAMSGVKF